MCEKQYNESYKLKRHKEEKHEGVRYPCDQCEIPSFVRREHLKRHQVKVHNLTPFECKKCDYKGTNKFQLIRHIKLGH